MRVASRQSISIKMEKITAAIVNRAQNTPATKTGLIGHHGNLHIIAITKPPKKFVVRSL